MADNINIPQNLTKVVEVKDTSGPLRQFLLDLIVRVNYLEKQVKDLQTRVKALE